MVSIHFSGGCDPGSSPGGGFAFIFSLSSLRNFLANVKGFRNWEILSRCWLCHSTNRRPVLSSTSPPLSCICPMTSWGYLVCAQHEFVVTVWTHTPILKLFSIFTQQKLRRLSRARWGSPSCGAGQRRVASNLWAGGCCPRLHLRLGPVPLSAHPRQLPLWQ